ncbi:GAP family protein [Oerskovia turbata]
MELLPLLGVLVVLALVDSTSFGTLLIPVWLLMTPGRVRIGRMLVYLGTIVGFYFVVGVVLALGADVLADGFGSLLETRPVRIVELLLGAGLVAYSFRLDRRSKSEQTGQGRVLRWRARAMGASSGPGAPPSGTVPVPDGGTPLPDGGARLAHDAHPGVGVAAEPRTGSVAALMGLALAAAAIELASMFPYLAAIGMLTRSDVGWPGNAVVLAGYCVVMVVPALVLMAGRVLGGRLVEPLLDRLNTWMTKNAASTTAWVVGIVGFLLARDAAMWLGWIG